MAEWVLVGNIRGPQGDQGEQGQPGQDAQLPSGGTAGQFLQKSEDGETWADAVTAVDISGRSVLNVNGKPINSLSLFDADEVGSEYPETAASITVLDMSGVKTSAFEANIDSNSYVNYASIGSSLMGPLLQLGQKNVRSITDEITSADASQLTTSKAVADYVATNKGDKLPEDGTAGQVLTKTEDGEEWQDTQLPDDVVTIDKSLTLSKGETPLQAFMLKYGDDSQAPAVQFFVSLNGANVILSKTEDDGSEQRANIVLGGSAATMGISCTDGESDTTYGISLSANAQGAKLGVSGKSVSSITDAIESSPAGNALVTDKAVADYVAANAPETPEASSTQYGTVKFASDEDFYEYMGISTWEELWTGSNYSVTVYQQLTSFDNLRITFTYSNQIYTAEIPAQSGTYDTADYGASISRSIIVNTASSYFTIKNSSSSTYQRVTFTKVEGK